MTTNDIVASALREYGEAFRGSWADLDGRVIQLDMYSFADALEGVGSSAGYTIEEWRVYLGICPAGGGHWIELCKYVGSCDDN